MGVWLLLASAAYPQTAWPDQAEMDARIRRDPVMRMYKLNPYVSEDAFALVEPPGSAGGRDHPRDGACRAVSDPFRGGEGAERLAGAGAGGGVRR